MQLIVLKISIPSLYEQCSKLYIEVELWSLYPWKAFTGTSDYILHLNLNIYIVFYDKYDMRTKIILRDI